MPTNLSNSLWTVVAAVGSSLGAAAVLTGLGGLLMAARFEAAGIPTELAVGMVPKPVLLTLGLEVALPLVFTSALVGVVIAATHHLTRKRPNVLLAALLVLVAVLIGVVATIFAAKYGDLALGCALGAALTTAFAMVILLMLSWPSADGPRAGATVPNAEGGDPPVAATPAVSGDDARAAATPEGARPAAVAATGTGPPAAAPESARMSGSERALMALIALAVALAGLAYEAAVTQGADATLRLEIVALVVSGVLVSLVAILEIESHVAEGAVILLVVLGVAGAVSWLRTRDNPKVRPVAAIRAPEGKPPAALLGIYVAATKDDVYLARVHLSCDGKPAATCEKPHGDEGTGDLLVLPRADVPEMAVGTNVPLAKVACRAQELMREVVEDTRATRDSDVADDPRGLEIMDEQAPTGDDVRCPSA